ncbi:tetratricopeptide repeat protein, partial [Spirosoma migulaei]
MLASTTVTAQNAQLQDQLFSQALKQNNTKQVVDLGQNFYRSAVQTKKWLKADFYATHIANVYCRVGTTHYKGGQYTLGITPTLLGLQWLARSRIGSDTLQFQLLSLAAACYGRIPLADSANYWFAQTGAYLSSSPKLRRTIPADVCGYYLSQSNFLNLTGDFQRAYDYLKIAIELARVTGNRRLVAIAYNYEGNYFFRLRQFGQAEAAYKKALHGYEDGSVDQCWGYIILGNNDRSAGQPVAGLAHLQIGLKQYKNRISQNPKDRHIDFEIQSNYYIAECQRALNQLVAATHSYQVYR